MRVVLAQLASALEPAANRAALTALGEHPALAGADLVVLPEAFARDFGPAGSDVAPYAEPLDGPFATAVADLARTTATTVVAGMFERSEDPARPWNTLVVRGAASTAYRKVHLYDSFGYRESDRLSAGPLGSVTLPLGGLTVGLMTCYDVRFPEQARRLVDAGADVLVLPSAWLPGPGKLDHWRTLVRARAIENTAYVVAVAQPGPRYTGHSLAVGPLGEVLHEGGEGPEVAAVDLDALVVTAARRTNPSLANRRFS